MHYTSGTRLPAQITHFAYSIYNSNRICSPAGTDFGLLWSSNGVVVGRDHGDGSSITRPLPAGGRNFGSTGTHSLRMV